MNNIDVSANRRRELDHETHEPEPWWPDWLVIIAGIGIGIVIYWAMG